MHRILNIAGNDKNKDDLIEQPVADFFFITSVIADLNLLSNLLLEKEFALLKNKIRALEISNLNSSAQIDNYLLKTINYAKVVVLRIFGDKGTWNYGIEQLINWQAIDKKRKLVILSGTLEQEVTLCEISSIDKDVALNISKLLRSGGLNNYRKFLKCLNYLKIDETLIPDDFINFLKTPAPNQKEDPVKSRGSITISRSLEESIKIADAIIVLRLQKERMMENLLSSIDSYSLDYGLTPERLSLNSKEIPILHPGPIN